MLRKCISISYKCIKTLLLYILYAIIALAIGMYMPVLLCDVLRLPWGICR